MRNVFEFQWLYKKNLEVYLEPCQISFMEYFCENSYLFLTVNYFCKKLHLDVWQGSECTFGIKPFQNRGAVEIQSSFWVGACSQRVINLSPLANFSDFLHLSCLTVPASYGFSCFFCYNKHVHNKRTKEKVAITRHLIFSERLGVKSKVYIEIQPNLLI